jgi:hypothetical protein
MELYIYAGIAYFLMLVVVLLFFGGASILNEDYDEISNAVRSNAVLPDPYHDINSARASAALPPTITASGVPSGTDQAVAMGRQAVALDKRATRSEIG